MIIVSQDRKAMTENMEIHIKKEHNPKTDEDYYVIENDSFILAGYKTEERAREVFKELLEAICAKSLLNINVSGIEQRIFGGFYEMPEE